MPIKVLTLPEGCSVAPGRGGVETDKKFSTVITGGCQPSVMSSGIGRTSTDLTKQAKGSIY